MSRISQAINIDDKISNRSFMKEPDQNSKHLVMLTDQLDLITQALHKKSEEAQHYKNLSATVTQQNREGQRQEIIDLEQQIHPLMEEIAQLNQMLENKQLENDKLSLQVQALEHSYIEKSQQNQQNQTGQLLQQNRTKMMEGENQQLKSQVQQAQNALQQLQQQISSLVNQNNSLQIKTQQLIQEKNSQGNNKQEIEDLHNNYKAIIDQKHDELNTLQSWLDTNKIKDDEMLKMKEYFELELKHQKNLSREMLQYEEERVRKDEQQKNQANLDDIQFENTRMKAQLKNIQDQKGFFENSILRSRQNDEIQFDLNQNHQQKIQQLQLELEKFKQNQSFSSAFDMTSQKVDIMVKDLETKNREVSELQYQCKLLKDQVQKKIDVIVQLESENEQLKEKQRFVPQTDQSGETMKIQYLLNHIESLSKQLVQPSPAESSPNQQSHFNSRGDKSDFQAMSENYGMATVTERASMESSQNTERHPQQPMHNQQQQQQRMYQSPINYKPMPNPIQIQQNYQPQNGFQQPLQLRTSQQGARYPRIN